MPQPKKPAEKRQRRNHADVGLVVRGGVVESCSAG
jgi:hypothetical protein